MQKQRQLPNSQFHYVSAIFCDQTFKILWRNWVKHLGRLKSSLIAISHSLYGHIVEVALESEFQTRNSIICNVKHTRADSFPGERASVAKTRSKYTESQSLIAKNTLQWLLSVIWTVASQGQSEEWRNRLLIEQDTAQGRRSGPFSVCRDRRFSWFVLYNILRDESGVRPASFSRALPHTTLSELLHTKLCRKLVRNPRWPLKSLFPCFDPSWIFHSESHLQKEFRWGSGKKN